MRLEKKVALITGVAGGIGAATAKRFAEEGALLAMTDAKRPGDKFMASIAAKAADHLFFQCDLTDRSAVRELFAAVLEKFGDLDILVNIAGGDYGGNARFEEVDAENLKRNIDANLTTTIYTCQEAVALMKARSSGSIVNMSSMTLRGSSVNQFAYSASKGAIFALTRTLAMTFGKHGIRVNAVAPGMIEVETIVSSLPDGVWTQVSKAVGASYPLGRVGQPVEVANCILFLASDEASFVTGEALEISGGGRL